MPWEHFSHEADVGVRGIGNSPKEAFEMAGRALTGIIINPDEIPQNLSIQIECEAPSLELLLVDWLNAIIYEMDTKKILFGQFQVYLEQNSLKATLKGENIDALELDLGVDVKGATYTELKVNQQNMHWVAQCVIDV